MTDKQLLENLSYLGFPRFEKEEVFDVNQTLAQAVQTPDMRLWEAFPVLLANAAKEPTFDLTKVSGFLADDKHKELFKHLFLLSAALYKDHHLQFTWLAGQLRKLSDNEKEVLKRYRDSLAHGKDVDFLHYKLSSERLRNVFRNYFEQTAKEAQQLRSKHEELSLEFSLSQVFSPKQKELFQKKLKGEKLTKTEREYFSRAVKKKVSALANPELHRLARKLLEY